MHPTDMAALASLNTLSLPDISEFIKFTLEVYSNKMKHILNRLSIFID